MFLKVFDYITDENQPLSLTYRGKVVDVTDPDKEGRIKVAIPNIYVGAKDLLPWVHRRHSDADNFSIPVVGDTVEVSFPDKDIYNARYTIVNNSVNLNDAFKSDYPNIRGYADVNGNKIIVNKETGEIIIASKSGSIISIGADGKISMTAEGDVEVVSPSKVSLTTDGTAEIKGEAGTDVGSAAAPTNVFGSVVNLGEAGGVPVAVLGGQCLGTGNLGAPVVSSIVDGSSKVFALK